MMILCPTDLLPLVVFWEEVCLGRVGRGSSVSPSERLGKPVDGSWETGALG
nr:TPA_asm: putative P6 protein [Prunus humilis associated luteovirus]